MTSALRQLGPVVATSIVLLFLLVSAVPLMHWFQSDSHRAIYEENLALWRASHVRSYRFTLELSCDCGKLPEMPIRILVDDGHDDGAIGGSESRKSERSTLPRSIDDVFDIAREGVDGELDEVVIDYDEDYGFPRSIFLDPDVDRFGDETSALVVAFDPRAGNVGE